MYAKKNFAAGEKSNIVAGLNIGFNKNKKGEFQYWSPKDSNFDKRIYTGISVGITF